jgi:hypothetical protein
LIAAWLGGFVAQAFVRAAMAGSPPVEMLIPALVPMSGVAFVLYTFYMATDPATTPSSLRNQVAFGLALAAAYGILVAFHVVYGLFFALTMTSSVRAAALVIGGLSRRAMPVESAAGLAPLRS